MDPSPTFAPFFSGIGHFQLGRPGWGCAWALAEAAGWASFAAWACLSTSSLAGAVPILLATTAVRLLSFLHVRRVASSSDGAALGVLCLTGALAGAFVGLVIVLRVTVLPSYKVPSSAMEPTILGDAPSNHLSSCSYRELHGTGSGDRIVASRLAAWLDPIRRFDVVVFRFPLNESRVFVNRVVGLPGEELVIRDGDLFARPGKEGKYSILRKPRGVLWFPVEGGDGSLRSPERFAREWRTVRGEIRLEEGVLQTDVAEFASSREFTDDSYTPVGDLRIAFRVQANRGEVSATVENGFGKFVARVSTEGGSLSDGRTRVPLEGVRLAPGTWHALDLSARDGEVVLEVDGATVGSLAFADSLEDARRRKDAAGTLGFGGNGEGIRIRDLEVRRDVHYRGMSDWREDSPLSIPGDSYVMLGDNVNSSHDSRSWRCVTFRLKDGRTVECEAQEVDNERRVNPGDRAGREDLRLIAADTSGRRVWISRADIDSETSRPFHFVDRRFIDGKVLRILWPPGRIGAVR